MEEVQNCQVVMGHLKETMTWFVHWRVTILQRLGASRYTTELMSLEMRSHITKNKQFHSLESFAVYQERSNISYL